MPEPNEGSVTRWIGELKTGVPEAADQLWGRYFARLARLARQRLQAAGGVSAHEDEEDAALSAFHSLWDGASQGRFDQLHDRDDLWKLLVVLTARKALDQVERRGRQKRGGGRVVQEATLLAGASRADGDLGGLDQFLGAEPTPEFAAMIAEEYNQRLDSLPDETLRQVALWRLEGYGNDEIAARLGCVARTVERKLEMIRKLWSREEAS